MNICMFIGNACRDVMMFKSKNGMDIAKFTLGVTEYNSKTKEESTVFVKCTAFGNLATRISKSCFKGAKVFVMGKFATSKYIDKQGIEKEACEFLIERYNVVKESANMPMFNDGFDGVESVENSSSIQDIADATSLDISSDDLPF